MALMSETPIRELKQRAKDGKLFQFEVVQAIAERFYLSENLFYPEKEEYRRIFREGTTQERADLIKRFEKEWAKTIPTFGRTAKEQVQGFGKEEFLQDVRRSVEECWRLGSDCSIRELTTLHEFNLVALDLLSSFFENPPTFLSELPNYSLDRLESDLNSVSNERNKLREDLQGVNISDEIKDAFVWVWEEKQGRASHKETGEKFKKTPDTVKSWTIRQKKKLAGVGWSISTMNQAIVIMPCK